MLDWMGLFGELIQRAEKKSQQVGETPLSQTGGYIRAETTLLRTRVGQTETHLSVRWTPRVSILSHAFSLIV